MADPDKEEEITDDAEPADETMISGGGDDLGDDDLEAQMAAAMAAEEAQNLVGDDDLEAQMAAAMAADGGGSDLLGNLADEIEESPTPVSRAKFQQLVPSDEITSQDNIDRLLDVGLNLSVELGRKDMQIRDILALGPGKIIELDKLAGEPVDLLVNGKLLAKGEVVVVDENFGVRITELLDPVDRIKML